MPSSAENKKSVLVSGLIEVRKSILSAASALPVRQRDKIFLGSWSAKDLLAHLIGWDYTNIEAANAVLAGRIPSFYAHYDKDWQTYNARLVAKYKVNNFAQLVGAVKKSHRELIRLLQSIPADEFDRDRGLRKNGYKITIARLLQAELDDERVHYQQITAFGQQVHPSA